MTSFEDLPCPENNDAVKVLAAEMERFSFGAATSPEAEVVSFENPIQFVRTFVKHSGVSIDHAHYPETKEQSIILEGEGVPKTIEGKIYLFDSVSLILIPGFGPPSDEQEVIEVADIIHSFNNAFEAEK